LDEVCVVVEGGEKDEGEVTRICPKGGPWIDTYLANPIKHNTELGGLAVREERVGLGDEAEETRVPQ